MPKGVVKSKSDEKKWSKAKKAAKGYKKGSTTYWKVVMHIYQNMKKKKRKKK